MYNEKKDEKRHENKPGQQGPCKPCGSGPCKPCGEKPETEKREQEHGRGKCTCCK